MADTLSRPHDSSDVFPVDGGAMARVRERTHWHGCWRDTRHHGCAAAEIGRLRGLLARVVAAWDSGDGAAGLVCVVDECRAALDGEGR